VSRECEGGNFFELYQPRVKRGRKSMGMPWTLTRNRQSGFGEGIHVCDYAPEESKRKNKLTTSPGCLGLPLRTEKMVCFGRSSQRRRREKGGTFSIRGGWYEGGGNERSFFYQKRKC